MKRPPPFALALFALFACDARSSTTGDPSPSTSASPTAAASAVAAAATAAPKPSPVAVVGPREPAPARESAVANGLSVVAHTVVSPPRTGDPKQDYWTQYEVYGEITNHSTQTFESVSARITFADASGAPLDIDSIGTAAQRDAGDDGPGESIYAEVHFVEPGQSVPFHYMRNLAAIAGTIGSHELHPRLGTPATSPPHAVALDVKDAIEGDGFDKKRVFSGTIRNDGEGGCRAPAFVVAFLDDAGKIASLDRIDASDDLGKILGKGESIAFSGRSFVSGESAMRERAPVKTWVDCQPIY